MARTQQLHSISGLATELGRDRRTIAAALSSVPPDGKKGTYPAWYLLTALDALSPKGWSEVSETFVDHLCNRMDGGRKSTAGLSHAFRSTMRPNSLAWTAARC